MVNKTITPMVITAILIGKDKVFIRIVKEGLIGNKLLGGAKIAVGGNRVELSILKVKVACFGTYITAYTELFIDYGHDKVFCVNDGLTKSSVYIAI